MLEYWNNGLAPFGQILASLRAAIGRLDFWCQARFSLLEIAFSVSRLNKFSARQSTFPPGSENQIFACRRLKYRSF